LVGHGNAKPNLGSEMKPVITAMELKSGATLSSKNSLCHMEHNPNLAVSISLEDTVKTSAVVPLASNFARVYHHVIKFENTNLEFGYPSFLLLLFLK
jgi:hypothetical protein